MNWEILKGIAERWITLGVGVLVGAGYVPEAIRDDVIVVAIMVVTFAVGWYLNKQSTLVATAASMPNVLGVEVDDPALAAMSKPGAKITEN